MTKVTEKIVSLLLAVVLLISMALPSALAESPEESSEGTEIGTAIEEDSSNDEDSAVSEDAAEDVPEGGEEALENNDEAIEEDPADGSEEPENGEANDELEASLDTIVCKNGDSGYTSLDAAISAASSGDTLTIVEDFEVTAKTPISKSLTITDDGNGHTIYFANATADSNNGRGLQVNSGVTVTITGGLTLCGHGSGENAGIYNYASMLFSYNGTLALNNVTITGSKQSTGNGAVCGYYKANTATGNVSVTNCVFSNNSCTKDISSGDDIYMNGSAKLTLSGCNSIPDVYSALDTAIDIGGTWDGAQIGLTIPTDKLTKGTQVISSDSDSTIRQAASCISIGTDEYWVSPSTGKIATRPVALIGAAEYSSLSAAIDGAASGNTITLVKDAAADSNIVISESITITDDGTARTIYVYNSDSENSYGRGITIKGSGINVNIKSTATGGITIIGHSKDDAYYNYSSVLYINRGTLTMDGVTVKECLTSSYAAIRTYNDYYEAKAGKSTVNIYTGTLVLNNCIIEDNTSKANSYGAAIYNQGNLYINDGTVIRNNFSRWDKGGGVYNDVHDAVNGADRIFTGITYLSGNVTVSGNMDSCSYQEGAGVNHDGDASDIYAATAESIVVNSVSGDIGIDYAGDDGRVFAACGTSYSGSIDCLHLNTDSTAGAVSDGSNIYWSGFCNINLGVAVSGGSFCYSYSGASVSIPSGNNAAALSVIVDKGQFSVDWTIDVLSTLGITKVYYIAADGSYDSAAAVPSVTEFRGISIEAPWSAAIAQSFIKSLIFSGEADGMTQNVTMGLSKSVSSGSVYFGGSTFSYVDSSCSYANASTAADSAGGHLAVPYVSAIDKLLAGAFGNTGYLGGRLLSDNWYWEAGRLEGTQITVSSASSQGYDNAYTNWNDGQPSGGDAMILESGKWCSANSSSSYGYYLEIEDNCAAKSSAIIKESDKQLRLTSISLTIDEGLAVNYYISFTDSLSVSDEAYVLVKVGENEAIKKYVVADIIKAENKSAYSDSYKISIPVSAKEMNADTELRFYGPSGRYMGRIGGDGHTQYNVRWYAENVILNKDSGDVYNSRYSQDLVTLVKALLNYGTAAQIQFGYNTDNLANKDFEDETIQTLADNITEATVSYGTGKQYYIEMIAGSKTIMRIRPVTTGSFTAAVDGINADIISGTDGNYIEVPVSADKLTRIYTIEFKDSFEDTLTLNAAGVIKAMLQNGSDAQKETCDKLYKLSAAANRYFGVYSPSASAIESVINTAYAYLEKTEYIDYDQRQMTVTNFKGHNNSRRQTNVSPEDATAQNRIYMDCSSFCYNVYREVYGSSAVLSALGIEKIGDMVTSELIGCSTEALVYSQSTSGIVFSELRETLQPGDLIVKYRNADGSTSAHGHIVLWTGSGFIHCTGSSYNYSSGTDNYDEGGAVHFVPSEDFNEYWYNGFDTVTVLRPLKVLGSAEISESAEGRRQTGPVAISKTAAISGGNELYKGRRVVAGDDIVYTITIANSYMDGTMNTARCVTISDTIPAGTSYISSTGGAEKFGSTLTWSGINIPVGETVTLSYTVSVTAGAGSIINPTNGSCECTGAGDSAKVIDFVFPYTIAVDSTCDSTANALTTAALNANGTAVTSGIETLNGIIASAVADASLGTSDTDWLDTLFGKYSSEESSVVYYYVKDYESSVSPGKYLVANFASGRKVFNYYDVDDSGKIIGNLQFDTDTRVRQLTYNNLESGDIIAVQSSDKYTYYVYISETEMVKIKAGENVSILQEDLVCDALTALLIEDCFAVFRIPGRA